MGAEARGLKAPAPTASPPTAERRQWTIPAHPQPSLFCDVRRGTAETHGFQFPSSELGPSAIDANFHPPMAPSGFAPWCKAIRCCLRSFISRRGTEARPIRSAQSRCAATAARNPSEFSMGEGRSGSGSRHRRSMAAFGRVKSVARLNMVQTIIGQMDR